MSERRKWILVVTVFLVFYFLPSDESMLARAVGESLGMLHEYAREHVLLCLIPAFFIAGAISVFVSRQSVLRYLGAGARKWTAYSVAAVSGGVLAVCSCTVLPLFAGIYKRGAGLGPATAFLYSGPAINVLAIVLTARVLGPELGLARAVGAVLFSVLIGLAMAFLFKREENERQEGFADIPEEPESRSLTQTSLHMAGMILFLVFTNLPRPVTGEGFWGLLYGARWFVATGGLLLTAAASMLWFRPDERSSWFESTRSYALQVLPLLFVGVLVAGFLLGRPGSEGLIPGRFVEQLVGGNGLFANLAASVAGAFMYFATLTEVPILQGLLGAGMGDGPALALLLAGPALSLPNMLVIRSVLGTRKTVVYVVLVIVMSAGAGMIFGAFA